MKYIYKIVIVIVLLIGIYVLFLNNHENVGNILNAWCSGVGSCTGAAGLSCATADLKCKYVTDKVCKNNDDCLSGYCDNTTKKCKNPTLLNQSCRSLYYNNNTCGGGTLACSGKNTSPSGTCKYVIKTTCKNNNDCLSGNCDSKTNKCI